MLRRLNMQQLLTLKRKADLGEIAPLLGLARCKQCRSWLRGMHTVCLYCASKWCSLQCIGKAQRGIRCCDCTEQWCSACWGGGSERVTGRLHCSVCINSGA